MTITVKAGEFTLTFPDGTSDADIRAGVTQFMQQQGQSLPEIPTQAPQAAQGALQIEQAGQAIGEGVTPLSGDLTARIEEALSAQPGARAAGERPIGVPGKDFPASLRREETEFLTPTAPPTRSEVGQAVGGIVGGLKGAAEGRRFGLGGALAGGAVGAFAGGAGGDITQSLVEEAVGSEFAPEGIDKALISAAQAGGEEAVLDIVGNLGFRAIRGTVRAFRPKARDNARLITDILEKGGSGPALSQVTDNAFYGNLEQLVRGSLVGSGRLKKLDVAQSDALVKYSNDYAEELAETSVQNLTPRAIGKVFVDTVREGSKAHSAAAGSLYANLDELVPDISVIGREIGPDAAVRGVSPGPVFEGTGAELKQVAAVDTLDLRNSAMKMINDLERIGNVGKAGDGGAVMDQMARIPDRMTFADAHALRSNLLGMRRVLSATREGDPIASNLSGFITKITKAMDEAGEQLSPEGLRAYKAASRFWKQGEQRFNNDLIRKLLAKEGAPTHLGDALFKDNNFDEVVKVRQALRTATRELPGRSFDETWRRVQGGYLQALMPTSPDQVLTAPIRKLHRDEKALRTLSAMFDKDSRGAIKEMSKAIDDILEATGERGFLNLRQASAGIQAAGTFGTLAKDMTKEAMIFLAGPGLFAQVAARPKAAKAWVKWAKADQGTPAKWVAASKFANLIGISVDELREISGEESVPLSREQSRGL